jgi:hypothetical protein
MLCTTCGRENPETSKFCVYCGQPIMSAVFPKKRELEGAIAAIAQAVQKRKDTDRTIPVYLGAIPIAISAALAIVAVALVAGMVSDIVDMASPEDYDPQQIYEDYRGYFLAMVPLEVAFYVFFGIIAYFLVKRNNDHFARDAALASAMSGFVDQVNLKAGLGRTRAPAYGSPWDNQWGTSMTSVGSKPRNPMLWAMVVLLQGVLGAVSIVAMIEYPDVLGVSILTSLVSLVLSVMTIYMWYFLMTDNKAHDQSWAQNAESFKVSLARLGYTAGSIMSPPRQPDRSFALYFVLSIITGVFVFYWWYVLVKDPNEHFRFHAIYEDEMLNVISNHPSWFSASASPR